MFQIMVKNFNSPLKGQFLFEAELYSLKNKNEPIHKQMSQIIGSNTQNKALNFSLG